VQGQPFKKNQGAIYYQTKKQILSKNPGGEFPLRRSGLKDKKEFEIEGHGELVSGDWSGKKKRSQKKTIKGGCFGA